MYTVNVMCCAEPFCKLQLKNVIEGEDRHHSSAAMVFIVSALVQFSFQDASPKTQDSVMTQVVAGII